MIFIFDDFNSFESENWQDQRIWVNNEKQCYPISLSRIAQKEHVPGKDTPKLILVSKEAQFYIK